MFHFRLERNHAGLQMIDMRLKTVSEFIKQGIIVISYFYKDEESVNFKYRFETVLGN